MKRRQLLSSSLLFLAGCAGSRSQLRGPYENQSKSPLTLSITDEQGLAPLAAKYEPLRAELSRLLNRDIEFYPVATTTVAAAGLQAGTIDLALAGPTEYVLIRARTNATPVFAITRPDYHSVGVVPVESPITELNDLKGKLLAMSDLGSTSGHLGPTSLLVEAGLDPQTDYTVEFLGDEGSLEALQRGEVDAWFGSLTDYRNFLSQDDVSADDYRQLVQSPPLPDDVLVVNSRTSPQFIEELRQLAQEHSDEIVAAITTIPANNKYLGSQVVSVADRDYDSIREAYRTIGQGNFLD
ncbi:MAG: phosphate/phosphite/phosphonate ABC transporter substrate-binding protein [Sodalinema sp.]|uniref:phosphate/phosphite/phosphonate ABC transporter substrate-binding protein n=1 Tax=Sodalinema sp. TaxID=3080550 RepID=UPI0012197CB6|nr:MAG: phosphate/phosphite/phosphonate ABC transporter substrate-binding protein [Phormidium sp. SL48-SHIP]